MARLSGFAVASVLLLYLACANGQALTPASATASPGFTATVTQFPTTDTAAVASPSPPPLFTPASPEAAAAAAAVPAATPAAVPAVTPTAVPAVSPAAVPAVTPAAVPAVSTAAVPAVTPAAVPSVPATTPVPAEQQPKEPIPAGVAGSYNLYPFNTIISCAPFNVLISPSSDNTTYSVTTAVNADVEAAVRFRVINQTLYIGFNRSFDSPEPIKVNITLPAGQLTYVSNKGLGDLYLNSGFATNNTTLEVEGTGRVFARGLNTSLLTVISTGIADVFAKGVIQTANVTTSGNGRITVAGVQQSITGSLEGISHLFVDGATDETAITLDAKGLSKVYYTKGKCQAGKSLSIDVPFFSMDLGLSSCVKVAPESFPRYKAYWSCGMRARGSAMCTPGAAEAAAAAASTADISIDTDSASATSAASSSSSSSATAAATSASSAPAASPAVEKSGSVSLLQQTTTDEAALAAEATADISLYDVPDTPAAAGRKLKTLIFPPFSFPPFPTFTSTSSASVSASSDDNNDDDDDDSNTVTVTIGPDGARTTTAGSADRKGTVVKVRSMACTAQPQELYIPAH